MGALTRSPGKVCASSSSRWCIYDNLRARFDESRVVGSIREMDHMRCRWMLRQGRAGQTKIIISNVARRNR